jgi:RNA polymerase sigma factor, sigma-70 family
MGSPDRRRRAARLMEEYSPALLAYFHRRVDAGEAADLLNDTLLVIWRQARSVPDDDDQARMWMYGIARRVLATHRRSHRRRSALHERLQAELTTVSTEDPDEVRALREALAQLPEIDQEIIRLVHWDGFTQVEVARLLDMPEATVRSRHQRARQRLRALLGAGSTAVRPTRTSVTG